MNQIEANKICRQCEEALDKLHKDFGVEPSIQVLKDLLFNFGKKTRRDVIEPLKTMYSKFGDENILTIEESLTGSIQALNQIIVPFGSVPLDISCRMYYNNGSIIIIGKF